MKKQIFAVLFVGLFALNLQAQTSATPLQTSTEVESSILSLRSYGAEGLTTLGTWAPPNGKTAAGRYLTLWGKVTHKASDIAVSGVLNFSQFISPGTLETSTAFDNPTLNVTKAWKDVAGFDEMQAGVSTTFVGNRDSAALTYRGSLAPNLKTVKKFGNLAWVQTLAYSRGFYGQSVLTNDEGSKENAIHVLKTGQSLGYSLSDALTVTAYGHGVVPITSSGHAKGRVVGCLGTEYAFNKMAVLGVGYGSGVNFLGLDPMVDQLALGTYNDSGYVELNLMF